MILYNILGVPPNATKKEIEKAYRAKAMKQHPDQGGNIEQFRELTLAYSVLKDEERRKRYDTTGQVEREESKYDGRFRTLLREAFLNSDTPIQAAIHKINQDIDQDEKRTQRLQHAKEKLVKRLDKFLARNTSEIVQETIEGAIAEIEQEEATIKANLDELVKLRNDFKEFKEPTDEPTPHSKFPEYITVHYK